MKHQIRILISVIFRIGVSVVAIALAVAIFAMLVRTAPTPKEIEAIDGVPSVMVMRAKAVSVDRQWEGYGTARAMDAVDVPARVSATVEHIPRAVEVGSSVEAGEVLAQLDRTDFSRQVEISTENLADVESQLRRLDVEERSWLQRKQLAEEIVDLARADFDRVKSVFDRGSARQAELDRSQNALLAAIRDQVVTNEEFDKLGPRRASLTAQKAGIAAQLRIANQNLDRSTIVAPLNGILEAVDIEEGENLSMGQRVARIVSLQRIEVPLQLPASARPWIRGGEQAVMKSTGAMSQRWDGVIARISPADDGGTRTMSVYVEINQKPDDPNGLVPGKFVRGSVAVNEATARWVVPRQAVSQDRIHIVQDNIVRSIAVQVDFTLDEHFPELGIDERQWMVLHDPLPDNAMVVISPTAAVVDGAEVRAAVAELAVRAEHTP